MILLACRGSQFQVNTSDFELGGGFLIVVLSVRGTANAGANELMIRFE